MAIDFFGFYQHCGKDLNENKALPQASSLYTTGIEYCQALKFFDIEELCN